MAAYQSPEQLFPALFGEQPASAKRAPLVMSPGDMRLLQYTMREAAKRPAPAQRNRPALPAFRPAARPAR